jgi:hypothetical protein
MPCEKSNNSDNGMMTKIWGPAGWLFLHCVSFGYPNDPDNYDRINQNPVNYTRNNYLNFFRQIGYVLPCRYCRDSYIEYISQIPLKHNQITPPISTQTIIHFL